MLHVTWGQFLLITVLIKKLICNDVDTFERIANCSVFYWNSQQFINFIRPGTLKMTKQIRPTGNRNHTEN